LLEKLVRFAEDPKEWHIKVKDLEAIDKRKAALEAGQKPSQEPKLAPLSTQEARFQRVCLNKQRVARIEAFHKTMQAMSALWLVEVGTLPKEHLATWFEGNTRNPKHIGMQGYEAGKAIQDSILWRQRQWPDFDFVLSKSAWTEKDLLPQADVSKLPVQLRQFWVGVRAGGKKSREDFDQRVKEASADSC
jgi:hypothetical protein